MYLVYDPDGRNPLFDEPTLVRPPAPESAGPLVAGSFGQLEPIWGESRCPVPSGWFRLEDGAACPMGYEAVGLRCVGPCGGYWCKPIPGWSAPGGWRGDLGGFGQEADAESSGFGIGTVVLAFGALAVVGLLIAAGGKA